MKVYTFDEMADLVNEYGDSLVVARKGPMKAKGLFKVLEEYNKMAEESNESRLQRNG